VENKPAVCDTVVQKFDVFTNEEMDRVFELKKEINGGEPRKDVVIYKQQEQGPLHQEIQDIIWGKIEPLLKDYYKSFLSPLRLYDLHHVGLSHDGFGSFTELHYESGYIEVAGNEHVVRQTIVFIYLNDDYEGGELHFPLHDFVSTPKKGSLMIFPTGYANGHYSTPVLKGDKFCARCTIMSPTSQHKIKSFHV